MALRPYRSLFALALVASVLTLLAVMVPSIHVAYRSPSLHVALETTAALVALLVAYLLLQRFLLTRRSESLLLLTGFLVLGTSHLAFLVVPATFPSISIHRFSTWAAVVATLIGASLLVAAALVPVRNVHRPSRAAAVSAVAAVATLAAVAAVMAVLSSQLPVGINPALSPDDGPRVAGHPLLLTAQLGGMVLFAIASVGFARRGVRERDVLLTWIAAGTMLGAFSRFNYFLFPSLYSHWVYVGDFFRLGFYVLLLVGAALEIRSYQHRLARIATLEERRRIARNLHDGLAQELAFIVFEGRRLANRSPDEAVGNIVDAARRALEESRGAIAVLASDVEQPLDVVVKKEAQMIAARAGARLRFRADPSVASHLEAREAVLRIVREAITNATRHGKARSVSVELSNNGKLVLRVADDGAGFDPSTLRGGGFGLQSMRQRVEALGGKLRVDSRPGAGTIVEAVVP